MKKAWNIIAKIIVWLTVIVAVAVMIFTVISVNTFNRNDRSIFGVKAFIVLSDSMSATDFDAGDLVMIKPVDPATLQEGDIIAFQSQDPETYGQTITHKIKGTTVDENGEPAFITYGTTTGVEDKTPVSYPFVIGKYQFAIPKVGTFFQFLKSPKGYIVCILVPFLLLILYQGLNCVKLFRQYKAEQMDELNKEKEELEAQRKKSEEMMAQLLAMKEQMDNKSQPNEPPAKDDEKAALQAEVEALRAQLAKQQAENKDQNGEESGDEQ